MDSCRNEQVTIVQTFPNVNEDLMELIFTIDAARRAGAKYVVVLLPYFPYARQDRKHAAGVPISARVVCDMLIAAGTDRLITLDLHSDQIQGFMSNRIVMDHLTFAPLLAAQLHQMYPDMSDFVFASPDVGGIKRARKLAKMCGSSNLCIMNKVREKANQVESIQLIGGVENRNVIVNDDMIDTAGTLEKGVIELIEQGAKSVTCVASHGINSGLAFERLQRIPAVVVTDSLPQLLAPDLPNMTVVKTSRLLLAIMDRVESNSMMSSLFDYPLNLSTEFDPAMSDVKFAS